MFLSWSYTTTTWYTLSRTILSLDKSEQGKLVFSPPPAVPTGRFGAPSTCCEKFSLNASAQEFIQPCRTLISAPSVGSSASGMMITWEAYTGGCWMSFADVGH
ncbi:SH3 domain-containing protein [Anopheles sinensis]|uniref:SH3 domain-containing protein n=1 Tax=Anopheles sinensis TaxID=74873 RepID=A0A084VT26_ANOSI|nr:SH3 domain-containing protein [Anopheles sinensis]